MCACGCVSPPCRDDVCLRFIRSVVCVFACDWVGLVWCELKTGRGEDGKCVCVWTREAFVVSCDLP